MIATPFRQRDLMVSAAVIAWMAGAAVASAEAISPRQAIERAAYERLGTGVLHVEVAEVVTRVEAHAGLVAVPDPAGYVGRNVRFALTVNGRRLGVAVAVVHVRARVAKAVRPIERGDRVAVDAVTLVDEELDGVRFARLPQLDEVTGARARRDIAPGVTLTHGMVAAPLDVQHGDRVTLGVTIGRVHVTGEGVASGSGYVGDVVHVMQTGRRGLLKGRIMERGVVEVMP